MNKKAIGLVLVGVIAGSSITAFAAGGRKIEVFDNVKKVVVNKINKPFTKGEEPFTYNGRTYVPLRYVSEALGENVDWDGKTGTVYIGDRYSTNYAYFGKDIKHMAMNTNNRNGVCEYYHGIDKTVENNIGEQFSSYLYMANINTTSTTIDFPLNGQYKEFTSNLGYSASYKNSGCTANVRILVDDKEVYKRSINNSDMPEDISIDLEGANKIRFELMRGYNTGVVYGNPKLTKK